MPYNYDPHKEDFKLADLDKDGKLSKSEFKKDILRDQPDMTDRGVDMLWAKADKNKDGLVSRKEAREHWDDFDREEGAPRKEGGVDRDKVMASALKDLLLKHPELGKEKKANHGGGGKRRLLQEEGGEDVQVVPPEVERSEEGRFDGGGEGSEGEAEAYQNIDGGTEDGGGEGGEENGEGGSELRPEDQEGDQGPRDGEELIDGENYDAGGGSGSAADAGEDGHANSNHYDYDGMYNDDYGHDYYHRYHGRGRNKYGYKPQSAETREAQAALEKKRARINGFSEKPLHSDPHEGWAGLKGYYAPENIEETDPGLKTTSTLGFPGSGQMFGDDFVRQAILGNDEVFTRMMSVDRHHMAQSLPRRNASLPMPGDRPKEEGFVFVDAHVLCTPIIADLDNDGHDEVVFSVSYYFDREQYSDPAAYEDLDVDVKINKYVAGGVAVYDLQSGKLKWHTHLDLTTDETMYRAYIYSSPSVADLDGDGILEVVVATSLGFIYVLEAKGEVREGFPVTMAEIQGQVGIADINDDGLLELVASDNRHNIAAFSSKGVELWERHMSGFSAQGPTMGDINGDGVVDVVLATNTGHVWAMNGV